MAFLMLMVSCAPMSKDKYLEQFDAFIKDVSENCRTYTDAEWTKMSEKYDKFVGEWYDKYESEFTTKDELHIIANQAKWVYFEKIINGILYLENFLDEIDTEEIKEQAEFYVKNNMMKDLEKLYDSAVKKGKETEEAVKEILEELDVELGESSK